MILENHHILHNIRGVFKNEGSFQFLWPMYDFCYVRTHDIKVPWCVWRYFAIGKNESRDFC